MFVMAWVVNARLDGDVAVLSNFGGLLNDPRHFDAGRDVGELLDQGCRKFVFEMANIREMGTTALGLLVTLTRKIRRAGGEAVLARPGPRRRRIPPGDADGGLLGRVRGQRRGESLVPLSPTGPKGASVERRSDRPSPTRRHVLREGIE